MKLGRVHAVLVHSAISGFIACCASAMVFSWYPDCYLAISGGTGIFALLLGVDAILGPFLTSVVYRPTKSKQEKLFDFSFISLLQISALVYGLLTVYGARPVYVVFEYQRMALVSAGDLTEEELKKAPPELRSLPKKGPHLLSLRNFKSADEQFESVTRAVAGQAQAAQPELWQSYEAGKAQILEVAISLTALVPPPRGLPSLVAKSGVNQSQLKYLPLVGRKGNWIMVIDAATAEPQGILEVQAHQS